jgi:hypothetical protein
MRPAVRMDIPALPPGVCFRCRVGSEQNKREYFVDTGISLDWEGVIYLCNMCLDDIARTTGVMYTKNDVDDLLSAQTDLVAQAQEIVEFNDGFREHLAIQGIVLNEAEAHYRALLADKAAEEIAHEEAELLRLMEEEEDNDERAISAADVVEADGTDGQDSELSGEIVESTFDEGITDLQL